ncbi:MAG: type II secretion system F family protein [Clostridia bacterium]|jgi:type IV pilus assembly protein PilC
MNIPKYRYKATNMRGQVVEGIFDAANQRIVIDMIRQKSYFPLEVTEIIEKKDVKELGIFTRVPIREIAIFCRQFATILKAGVPIIQGLDIVSGQVRNRNMKRVLEGVYGDLQTGMTLSESLAKFEGQLSGLLIHMIEAGEVSGELEMSLERMADHFEKEYKLRQKVRSALIYPIIVSIVALTAVYFLIANVVPSFVNIFNSNSIPLPAATRMLLSISSFLDKNGAILFFFLVVMIVFIKLFTSKGKGRYLSDKLRLQLPFLKGLYIKIISARFCRALSTLLSEGVSLTQSLEIVSRIIGNVVIEKGILNGCEELRQGKSLSEPLSLLGYFPPMIIQMIYLGEESGTMDEMLQKAAEYYEMEVETAIQRMTTLIEPAVIVILGGVVAFIVLSTILPIFDMMSLIG